MENKIEMDEEKRKVAGQMMDVGGSFVEHLGKALSRADLTNAKRIKEAFPGYWKEYLAMAEAEESKNKIEKEESKNDRI